MRASVFLKDSSLSTEKGGSWVNVKSDSNWPGAQHNLEITEIQTHLKTTVQRSLYLPASNAFSLTSFVLHNILHDEHSGEVDKRNKLYLEYTRQKIDNEFLWYSSEQVTLMSVLLICHIS